MMSNSNMPITSSERRQRPRGFLPMDTNLFDRYFISIVLLVAIHLIWFRFLEQTISINVATIISLILMFVIVRWG